MGEWSFYAKSPEQGLNFFRRAFNSSHLGGKLGGKWPGKGNSWAKKVLYIKTAFGIYFDKRKLGYRNCTCISYLIYLLLVKCVLTEIHLTEQTVNTVGPYWQRLIP